MDEKESLLWHSLVKRGKQLRKGKMRHRKRTKSKADSALTIPETARRWIVARAEGMRAKDADRLMGTTWEEVNRLYRFSEECRFAVDAMYESIRALEIELAYSDVEKYMLCGKRHRKAKKAMTLLVRMGQFAKTL